MLEKIVKRILSHSVFSRSRPYLTLAALAITYLPGCSEKPYWDGKAASVADTSTPTEDSYTQQNFPEASETSIPKYLSLCLKDKDKDTYFDKSGNQPPDESGECQKNYTKVTYSPGDIVPFDCDGYDDDNVIYPGAEELCDNKDNDCDGKTDEGVYITVQTICGEKKIECLGLDKNGNPTYETALPPKESYCDGKDDNCNGQIDEKLTRPCSNACGSGLEYCIGNNKWGNCDAPQPSAEICDGYDNDCDGKTDESLDKECNTLCDVGTEICVAGQWVDCDADKNCCTPGSITNEIACPYDPHAFLFIIDHSGSMSDSDPNMLRYTGAIEFVDKIENEEKSGLIVYSSNAEMMGYITSNKELVKSYLSEVMTNVLGGETNIPAAMLLGIDELKSISEKRVIILLTDGQSNVGDFNPNYLKNQAQSNDIRIYTLGLGPDVNSSQLNELATPNGGYYFVNSASDISSIYNTILNTTKNEMWEECDETGNLVQKYGECK